MDGSHPEEKSDFWIIEDIDPIPKRNLVKEPRIPPRRKFRVGELEIQKLVIKLLPPPPQQQQQQQQLSQF